MRRDVPDRAGVDREDPRGVGRGAPCARRTVYAPAGRPVRSKLAASVAVSCARTDCAGRLTPPGPMSVAVVPAPKNAPWIVRVTPPAFEPAAGENPVAPNVRSCDREGERPGRRPVQADVIEPGLRPRHGQRRRARLVEPRVGRRGGVADRERRGAGRGDRRASGRPSRRPGNTGPGPRRSTPETGVPTPSAGTLTASVPTAVATLLDRSGSGTNPRLSAITNTWYVPGASGGSVVVSEPSYEAFAASPPACSGAAEQDGRGVHARWRPRDRPNRPRSRRPSRPTSCCGRCR